MGTIVDVVVPSEHFALEGTFDATTDATLETVCVVAHDPGQVMPFLWGSSADLDRLDESLAADPSTHDASRLARDDGRALYRIDWRTDVRVAIGVFVEANGTLLRARGQDHRWELRVLFPDQESVSRTYETWREHGIDPAIRRVNGVDDVVTHGGLDLSHDQHEALVTAFEHDYYSVPRGITLDDLAGEIGVSHQALSERLRRGHRNLVKTTLCEAPHPINREP